MYITIILKEVTCTRQRIKPGLQQYNSSHPQSAQSSESCQGHMIQNTYGTAED
jgi:hypothetical protein